MKQSTERIGMEIEVGTQYGVGASNNAFLILGVLYNLFCPMIGSVAIGFISSSNV
jgi:hypothetical protein